MKNRFFYFVILLLAVCLSANANDFKKKRKNDSGFGRRLEERKNGGQKL